MPALFDNNTMQDIFFLSFSGCRFCLQLASYQPFGSLLTSCMAGTCPCRLCPQLPETHLWWWGSWFPNPTHTQFNFMLLTPPSMFSSSVFLQSLSTKQCCWLINPALDWMHLSHSQLKLSTGEQTTFGNKEIIWQCFLTPGEWSLLRAHNFRHGLDRLGLSYVHWHEILAYIGPYFRTAVEKFWSVTVSDLQAWTYIWLSAKRWVCNGWLGCAENKRC